MAEFISNDEVDEIIRINLKIVDARNESFGVNESKIYNIINSVNLATSADLFIFDDRKRIIKKASMILACITWEQPFNNGNKTTALYFTIQYLNKNKFDLLLSNSKVKNQIFNLLKKTELKFENDESIIEEVFQFLDKNVSEFKFKDW